MKFGVMYANYFGGGGPEAATALGRAAENAGFDSLWTSDHVVVPLDYQSPFPYDDSKRAKVKNMDDLEELEIPDSLIWLTHVAATCPSILLATGVMVLPQRNPVLTAKQAASLDLMSGGRAILGVGVGWLAEEFDALGVPFTHRGARLEEYIEAMRRLWTGKEATMNGRHVDFTRVVCRPAPVRQSIPIVIGGHSEIAARRAGRLGDGFYPAHTDGLPHLLDIVRRTAREHGRDPDAIEVTVGGVGCIGRSALDNIKRLADLGVGRVTIPPLAPAVTGIADALARYGEDVIAHAPGAA
jgi:probable F420-dependent oxidoreductase